MASLGTMLTAPIGNPQTSATSSQHAETTQSTAPAASIGADVNALVIALAAMFVLIFVLHKVEKLVKRGA